MKANLEPVFRARRRGVFTQIVKIGRRQHNLYFYLGEVAETAVSVKTRLRSHVPFARWSTAS